MFHYMNMSFTHEVMCCLKCGMVFIPEYLAEGKMTKVERMMEDK
jgi:hypothetical protein